MNNRSIYNGIVSNNYSVLKYIVSSLYLQIRNQSSSWIEGDNYLNEIVEKFFYKKIKKLQKDLINYPKMANKISLSCISAYCQRDIYKVLFEMDIVFDYLMKKGREFVKFKDKIKVISSITINDICQDALIAFYEQYVINRPNDSNFCSIKRYYKILNNKTIDHINYAKNHSQQPKPNKANLTKKNLHDIGNNLGGLDLNKDLLSYVPQHSLKDMVLFDEDKAKTDLLKEFGRFFKDNKINVDDLIREAKKLVSCFMEKRIGSICIQVLISEFYGFNNKEIKEQLEYKTENSLKSSKSRCHKEIAEKCSFLRSYLYTG
jgi:hypothetical protein